MISVVGTGPGGPEHITPAVAACIRAADIVIGYSTYLDLLNDLLVDKEVISSSMMQEVARCRRAFDLAEAGRRVVMVSGGIPASTPWPVSSSRSPWSGTPTSISR